MKKTIAIFMSIFTLFASLPFFSACSNQATLDYATFTSQTFSYDGLEKSIVVTGVPQEATITYEPTNKYTDIGEYNITAVVTLNKNITKTFTATLTIAKTDKVYTAEEVNALLFALKEALDSENQEATRYISALEEQYNQQIEEIKSEITKNQTAISNLVVEYEEKIKEIEESVRESKIELENKFADDKVQLNADIDALEKEYREKVEEIEAIASANKTELENRLASCKEEINAKIVALEKEYQVKAEELEYKIANYNKANVLYGKKWVACGDSFTEGDFSNSPTNDYIFTDGKYKGKNKVYPFFIGERNNMTIVNEAKCGSTLAYTDGKINEFATANGRYTKIPSDADYITLKFGINDSGKGVPIGTIDDTVNTTFYGAWNIVLEYLITNFPFAKIGVIVTNGTKGAKALEYVTATINACKKWGIPYLDEATGENIPLMLRSLRTDVCEEAKIIRDKAFSVLYGVNGHPNAKAHEFESTIVEAWLRTL